MMMIAGWLVSLLWSYCWACLCLCQYNITQHTAQQSTASYINTELNQHLSCQPKANITRRYCRDFALNCISWYKCGCYCVYLMCMWLMVNGLHLYGTFLLNKGTKCFTIGYSFTHTHTHWWRWSCHARRGPSGAIRGFSVLTKGTSTRGRDPLLRHSCPMFVSNRWCGGKH